MALKALIDSLDGLSDDTKAHYEETEDGKFRLAVEPAGGFVLENVDGLKSALGKERTDREKLERQFAKFKDLDPDKAREALQKWDEFKDIDPAKEADRIVQTKLEAAKTQLLEKHQSEISERDERVQALRSNLESLLVDQAATAALAEAKGSVELLLPHIQRFTRVKETDSGFAVEVVDKDGNARIADSKGTPMDIKALVAEMRESDAFGRAFDASGNSGSDSRPSSGGMPGQMPRGDMGGDRASRQAAIAQKFKLPAQ